MQIADLARRHVCILGYGKEGQAAAEALLHHAPGVRLSIADANIPSADGLPGTLVSGPDYLEQARDLQADWYIKSPGIPPLPVIQALRAAGRITTGTNLFFQAAKAAGARIIGVTGSKGKSTTSSLMAGAIQACGLPVELLGNIGTPMISRIGDIRPDTWYVAELSSYQLMDLERGPDIAVITSFFPEHLDYHGSLEAYFQAKARITETQCPTDLVVYNAEQAEVVRMASLSPARRQGTQSSDCPLDIEDTKLLGRHNLGNIALVLAVIDALKLDRSLALESIKQFAGLPHRLQFLGIQHGIEWVDDAISTTPDSTIAALDALGDRVATIILGGQDRGVPYEHLGTRIAASQIRTVILFPGSGPRIREAIGDARADVCFHEAESMDQAVACAKAHTMSGKICLLSTASPSYGMFKNFEEKGSAFAKCIDGA